MLREVVSMDELCSENFVDNLMIKGPLDFYRENAESKIKKIRSAILKNNNEISVDLDSIKKIRKQESHIISRDSFPNEIKQNFENELSVAEYTSEAMNRDLTLGIDDINFDEIYQNFKFSYDQMTNSQK